MKSKLSIALLLGLVIVVMPVGAQTSALNGTWSGNWTPKGGVPDAITIELRESGPGAVTGKFVNPAQMEFAKATFNAKTGATVLEATDQKSGKTYKIQGTVKGTELVGTLVAGDTTGEVRLIKWTFFGR